VRFKVDVFATGCAVNVHATVLCAGSRNSQQDGTREREGEGERDSERKREIK